MFQVAARDIVQFVDLQRFLLPGVPGAPGVGWSKDLLARDVLAELPDQVVGYMKSRGVQPGAVGGSNTHYSPT